MKQRAKASGLARELEGLHDQRLADVDSGTSDGLQQGSQGLDVALLSGGNQYAHAADDPHAVEPRHLPSALIIEEQLVR